MNEDGKSAVSVAWSSKIYNATDNTIMDLFSQFQLRPDNPLPAPPPPGIGIISIFIRLGRQILGSGDSWAVKSPGVGAEKDGKCPDLRQHCNIFHWVHTRIVPF